MLVVHWLDVQYLIMPQVVKLTGLPVGLIDVCCMVGMGAIFVAGVVAVCRAPTADSHQGPAAWRIAGI